MLQISRRLTIPSSEIQITATRSQGPGGQNVNKVASAVHLRFDILNSSLPQQYKDRLLALRDRRITKDGVLILKVQQQRNQKKNREIALNRLKILITSVMTTAKKRIATSPTKGSKLKRMEKKAQRAKLKTLRQKIDPASMLVLFLLLTFYAFSGSAAAQKIITAQPANLQLLPRPQKISFIGQSVLFKTGAPVILTRDSTIASFKASNYLKKILTEKYDGQLSLVETELSNLPPALFHIFLALTKADSSAAHDQQYQIKYAPKKDRLQVEASSQLGLLFAVVTLSEFFHSASDAMILDLYKVDDWPTYQRRIFSAIADPESIENLLDFALRYKFETLALASRQYAWQSIDPAYDQILETINTWRTSYGGPDIMQSHNIYAKEPIVISDQNHIAGLKQVIEKGILSGVDKLMILADDTPPFKFGEGYILTDERDKAAFAHMAAAHCYLLTELRDWLREKAYNCEMYYVPAFYTFEDARYGDLFLYKNTPWEADAFAPLERDLAYFGKYMPADIFIVWTGPNVRSRTITENDLQEWTSLLGGRIPFLWDNTIYSQHPFTTTALFTAYDNHLPKDFANLTAGKGMFINGDVNSVEMQVAAMTTADFLWQPQSYQPEQSLRLAMQLKYGKELVDPLLAFKETELALRKMIGERKLWFKADTLWREIIDTKLITGKNPFYYHLNYSRLKALRIQLKHSVPQPSSQKEFLTECNRLAAKRNELLEVIQSADPGLYKYLCKILISMEK